MLRELAKQLKWEFDPDKDITAYELWQLLGRLVSVDAILTANTEDPLSTVPLELHRHFKSRGTKLPSGTEEK